MSGIPSPIAPAMGAASAPPEPRPSLAREIAAILGLLAVAIILGVVELLLEGQTLSISSAIAAWSWVFTVAIVLIVFIIAVWTVRLISRGLGVGHHERHHDLRRMRDESPAPATIPDPAVQIARERFARGEITQEQFDQIMRQLGR